MTRNKLIYLTAILSAIIVVLSFTLLSNEEYWVWAVAFLIFGMAWLGFFAKANYDKFIAWWLKGDRK